MAEQKIEGVTMGKFKFDLTVNPNEKLMEILVVRGYKSLIQDPIAKFCKEFGSHDAAGKPVKGFKRGSIEWSQANAEKLKKYLDGLTIDISETDTPELIDNGLVDVSVPELYEGTVYTPKYGEQKALVLGYLFAEDGKTAKKLKSGEDRSVESFCLSRNIEAPTDPWQEDTDFLAAVKEYQVTERKRLEELE